MHVCIYTYTHVHCRVHAQSTCTVDTADIQTVKHTQWYARTDTDRHTHACTRLGDILVF